MEEKKGKKEHAYLGNKLFENLDQIMVKRKGRSKSVIGGKELKKKENAYLGDELLNLAKVWVGRKKGC